MAFSAAAGRGVWAENAVDTLKAHFDRAHNSLLLIEHRLEADLKKQYGNDSVNPIKFQSRLRKLNQELARLESDCRKLHAEKREFVESTVSLLVDNKNTVDFMRTKAGVDAFNDEDDSSSNSLEKTMREFKSN